MEASIRTPDEKFHAAFHEASHVVIAYCFNWYVNDEGVRIQPDGYCGLGRIVRHNTERADCCITLAGWLAETCISPDYVRTRSDEDLAYILDNLDYGEDDSDDGIVLSILRDRLPERAEAVIVAYRNYERETLRFIKTPVIWRAIDVIANELMQWGRLTKEQVAALVPDEVIGIAVSDFSLQDQ